ncbi:hypothetical protein A2282_00680 [candidate division WOR-1 bacterium RIFOXYA12_FULL_36_13]|nr:MAG: hypothetical protein A2282_00680 [candidate division WOR-1 bacterium RIFOXYA12_FULL_36_13]
MESTSDIIILDEIHKYKKWKTLVKGFYDKFKDDRDITVTGSSRLDIYRREGDSLQGRYHYYRLHPFTLAEVLGRKNNLIPSTAINFESTKESWKILNNLLKYGGFPEPFIAQDEKTARRWQNERIERMFREDIRDVEIIRDLGSMEILGSLLPEKASGLLSINSLREDLEVSHKAVTNWINLLEKFYYHFRIYPFSGKKIRSLKKESKIYLWDWSEIKNLGKLFENLVASHLLKLVHYLHDAEGYNIDLYFLRDTDGREVDFLITIGQKPWFAVEVKTQEKNIAKNLLYFAERLKIPYLYQVILEKNIDKRIGNIRLISADKFLSGLV